MVTSANPNLAAVLRNPHRIRPRVFAFKGVGTPVEVPVTACVVTKDAGAYPRTKAAITVADLEYAPTTLDALLLPWNTQIQVEAEVTDGQTTITIPVAHLWLDEVTINRPDSNFVLSAPDFSQRIADHWLEKAYTPTKGTRVQDAIKALIRRSSQSHADRMVITAGVPTLPYGDGGALTGNPWAAIEKLADMIGCECFLRYDDVVILRPVPLLAATGLFNLDAGTGGILTNSSTTVARAYNRVVEHFGNQKDANGKALADRYGVWESTTSPTNPSSGYGYVTLVENQTGTATQGQADTAALNAARRVQGLVRTSRLTTPTLPQLEPGDTVNIRFATGLAERAIMQSHVIDLTPSGSSVIGTRSTTWLAT